MPGATAPRATSIALSLRRPRAASTSPRRLRRRPRSACHCERDQQGCRRRMNRPGPRATAASSAASLFRERKQAVCFATDPPPPPPEPARRPAQVARLLALARYLNAAIERAVVADQAAVARKLGADPGSHHAAPRPEAAGARPPAAGPRTRGGGRCRAARGAAAPGRHGGGDVAAAAGGAWNGEPDHRQAAHSKPKQTQSKPLVPELVH